jgi:indoleamine 2,3-dioxygenase
VTYSDDVLYNWRYLHPSPTEPLPLPSTFGGALLPPTPLLPTPDNLQCLSLFTGTRDEEVFYLTSARIELQGVRALALMRASLDEAFVDDALAQRRIAGYLRALAGVIAELERTLLAVRDGCDPTVFYEQIRPWFKGEDSSVHGRRWLFDGVDDYDHELKHPTELSGPSAGQSSLVHALDVFLGVDHYSTPPSSTTTAAIPVTTGTATTSTAEQATTQPPSFMKRMQTYMPRHHRAFLDHLGHTARPLRALVADAAASDPDLVAAYDGAVRALKRFRDAHMRIVALYIVQPARRYAARETAPAVVAVREGEADTGRWLAVEEQSALKGTGGTELVRFLKGVRDRTAGAVMGKAETL